MPASHPFSFGRIPCAMASVDFMPGDGAEGAPLVVPGSCEVAGLGGGPWLQDWLGAKRLKVTSG